MAILYVYAQPADVDQAVVQGVKRRGQPLSAISNEEARYRLWVWAQSFSAELESVLLEGDHLYTGDTETLADYDGTTDAYFAGDMLWIGDGDDAVLATVGVTRAGGLILINADGAQTGDAVKRVIFPGACDVLFRSYIESVRNDRHPRFSPGDVSLIRNLRTDKTDADTAPSAPSGGGSGGGVSTAEATAIARAAVAAGVEDYAETATPQAERAAGLRDELNALAPAEQTGRVFQTASGGSGLDQAAVDGRINTLRPEARQTPDTAGLGASDNGEVVAWSVDRWVNATFKDANGYTWTFDATDDTWSVDGPEIQTEAEVTAIAHAAAAAVRADIPEDSTDLDDMPNAIVAGQFLKGNASGDGYEQAAIADADIPASIARDSEVSAAIAGTASSFTDLDDTPTAYTGQGGKHLAVNAGATAVEFVDAPAGGGGGLDQDAVDARVVAGVKAYARAGSTERIPASDLPHVAANVVHDAAGTGFPVSSTGADSRVVGLRDFLFDLDDYTPAAGPVQYEFQFGMSGESDANLSFSPDSVVKTAILRGGTFLGVLSDLSDWSDTAPHNGERLGQVSLYLSGVEQMAFDVYLGHNATNQVSPAYVRVPKAGTISLSVTVPRISAAITRQEAAGGGAPTITHETFAADRSIACPEAVFEYSTYAELYRYTPAAAGTFRFDMRLMAEASWVAAGGGNRAAAKYRLRRMNSAGVAQQTFAEDYDVYPRNLNLPDGTGTFRSVGTTLSAADAFAAGDYLLLEGQAAQQNEDAGRSIDWASGEQYIDITAW